MATGKSDIRVRMSGGPDNVVHFPGTANVPSMAQTATPAPTSIPQVSGPDSVLSKSTDLYSDTGDTISNTNESHRGMSQNRDGENNSPNRGEIDAKMSAIEARLDAKIAGIHADLRVGFADLTSKFSEVNSKLNALEDRHHETREAQRENLAAISSLRWWMVSSALAVIAVTIALTLGDRANILSSFSAGLSAFQAAHVTDPTPPSTPSQRH